MNLDKQTPSRPPILWQPQSVGASQLDAFTRHIEDECAVQLPSYEALHHWSIANPALFWRAIWQWGDIKASAMGDVVIHDGERFDSVSWFPRARLNFAENLLRWDDDSIALVGLSEEGDRRELSYRQLRLEVAALAESLRQLGVQSGDRVAAIMPNVVETVVAMLATVSVGAVWTSCSPDFGFNAAFDRFSQVSPKILFCADGYIYNGKRVDTSIHSERLSEALSSVEHRVVVDFLGDAFVDNKRDALRVTTHAYRQLIEKHRGAKLYFEQLPFNHPLYILYSSGTTGKPKCIVHGAGGTLLQHLKEHQLHANLGRDDVFFYFTTCGWMMWNWLVSGLASGCTVVCYDGSPFAGDGNRLLDAIDDENISVFGVGAKYIDALEKAGKQPRLSHSLASVRTILSTGSPLSVHSYQWIYEQFKSDICLSSISGGTDIISCFVLGNPDLPVYAGEIQCKGLGMAVEIFNDRGESVVGEKGELVCTRPFPSAPLGFWNDAEGARYHRAYFSRFDNVWAHGDYGEITDRGTVIIYGRSDAVLNPGGVRIGTAEIYRQVETVTEIIDSVVVGQQWEDDERVILFVVVRDQADLTSELEQRLRQTIREHATPRHVPARIIAVADVPKTMSGKVSELAVKHVIHGRAVENTEALANPEALQYFEEARRLLV